MSEEKKAKVGAVIIGLLIAGVGIAAIIYPDLLDSFDAGGRRALYKSVLKWAWGIPGGITAVLLGGFIGYAGVKGADMNTEDKTS